MKILNVTLIIVTSMILFLSHSFTDGFIYLSHQSTVKYLNQLGDGYDECSYVENRFRAKPERKNTSKLYADKLEFYSNVQS